MAQQYRIEKAPLASRMILSSDTITSGGVRLRSCFSKPDFRPAAAVFLLLNAVTLMCCNEKLYHSFSVCGGRLTVFDHFS